MKRCGAMVLAAVLVCAPAPAHETDQYTLPLDGDFADLGDYFDAVHLRALEQTVNALNEKIGEAVKVRDAGGRARRLAQLHDPDTVQAEVYSHFNDAFTEIMDIEDALRSDWARRTYGDKRTAYRTWDWIYMYSHAWLDPRRLILAWQSSTVKAYGVYFGTDKLSHFHHMGRFYYGAYRRALARGDTPEEATAAVVGTYSSGSPIGENGLLGIAVTGVYSNADLVANYAGFKFYVNLTEPVMLKGQTRPPLLVRIGDYWALNTHVRADSGWFGWYVSDHWNEVFNPCVFDVTIKGDVGRLIRDRAPEIMRFWVEKDARPADREYYDSLTRELFTYYGEPYGHEGDADSLFTVANTILPAARARGEHTDLVSLR